MAFTYNTDLATNRDKLRFLINDTDNNKVLYADAELDGVLSLQSNIYRAAALALRARAAAFIGRTIEYSIGAGGSSNNIRIDRRSLMRDIKMAVEMFETLAASLPEEYMDRFDLTIDRFGVDDSEYQGDID